MMWPIIWTFKQSFQLIQKPQPQKQPQKQTPTNQFITTEDIYRLLII